MKSQSPLVQVYLGCSLDGFIAGPENALDWLQNDYSSEGDLPASESYLDYPAFFANVGCLLMGRTTYDVVSGFEEWPYGDLPVLVASHKPIGLAPSSVQHVQGDINDLVAQALQLANGKSVYLDGGNLVRQGLNACLVDQVTLTYLPILLGKGIPLFEVLDQSKLLQFTKIGASGKGHVQVSCRTKVNARS